MNDQEQSTNVIDTSSSEDFSKNKKSVAKNNDTSSLEYNQSNELNKKKFCQFRKIFVRLIHLTLVLFITGNLFIQNTSKLFFLKKSLKLTQYYNSSNQTGLREALINREFVYLFCFIGLTYTSLLFYFLTCLKNPGYVEKNEKPCSKDIGQTGLPNIRLRYCTYCELEQPIRSRHCEECKRCIKKFDHHCPWLETCVGEKNHKYFWFFLGSTNILIVWCIIITTSAFLNFPNWTQWLVRNLLFLFNMQVLVIAYCMSFALFLIHTYFMITNTTTWERFSRQNITYLKIIKNEKYNPFHQSYLKNIYLFLCSPKENKWENVYATFFKNKVKTTETTTNTSSSENECQIKIEQNVNK